MERLEEAIRFIGRYDESKTSLLDVPPATTMDDMEQAARRDREPVMAPRERYPFPQEANRRHQGEHASHREQDAADRTLAASAHSPLKYSGHAGCHRHGGRHSRREWYGFIDGIGR
jgi:hypothetical protein